MLIPKVTNMDSPRTGNPVANQFIISFDGGEVFQSYSTRIAMKSGDKLIISSNYNYSVTTGKYFNEWLRNWGVNGIDIDNLKKWLKKAKDGDTSSDLDYRFTVVFVDDLSTYAEDIK